MVVSAIIDQLSHWHILLSFIYCEKADFCSIQRLNHLNDFFQIPTLVHAMILTEVWKHKVFPIICKLQDFNPKSTFLLYMVVSGLSFKLPDYDLIHFSNLFESLHFLVISDSPWSYHYKPAGDYYVPQGKHIFTEKQVFIYMNVWFKNNCNKSSWPKI